MKIFSGSANKPLSLSIADCMHLTLSPAELYVFPDGERRVWIEQNVLGEECVVIQTTSTPVDTHYMELFFLLDGLKRSGARSITLVMPYVGYQRQDHIFRSGEAVSMEVIVKILEVLRIDRFIAVDLHSIKIPEFFTLPVMHLSALELFAQEIKTNGWNSSDSVLVTPDMGGIRRIKILSAMLDKMPYMTIVKNRDLATGEVEAASSKGEVKRRAIIVDDMISSGHTIVEAAKLLQKQGAEEIIVMATHAVFSSTAPQLLQDSLAAKIYVTDSVYISSEKQFAKLIVLSLAPLIARKIK